MQRKCLPTPSPSLIITLKLRICLALFACTFALAGREAGAQRVTEEADQFVAWARTTTHPLPQGDSAWLTADAASWILELTRHARVVGVGESAHDMQEFLELRAAITRTLVQHNRVAAIVMETGLAEASSIGHWINRRNSPRPDFEHDLSYGFGAEAELVKTLEWIRDYNLLHPFAVQVRFYGADLPSDGGGSLEPVLQPVLAYLDRVDPLFGRGFRAGIEPIAQRLDTKSYDIIGRYRAMPGDLRDTLRLTLGDLTQRFRRSKLEYVRKSSLAEYDWMSRLVDVARQTETAVRIGWNDETNPRDRAMAENVAWVEANEGKRGVVLVWAHNLHVARAPITGPVFESRGGPPVASMGEYLKRDLGRRYVAIGTAFRTYPGDSTGSADSLSVDAALARLGNPLSVVVLRNAPSFGPAAAWLKELHLMRAEDSYVKVRLGPAYDAVIFIDSVHRAARRQKSF